MTTLISYNDFMNELAEFNKIVDNEKTTTEMIERARFGLAHCFINTDFSHEDKTLKEELQKIAFDSRFNDASRRMEWLVVKSFERTYSD